VAQVKGSGVINQEIANLGLKMLGVDANGLTDMDRRYLDCLFRHGGAPVGLKTIAMNVGEEDDTLENVYEPYLIREGYVSKTPQGRKLTVGGYAALGKTPPASEGLF
ncbi:MAG: Holliday junction branch migration DNA helicase RuvB, partial [Planctomycetes bacterium]|nr:Holliday junction branch migration DNA helicase RuvB [Planctomycetota bacterium]